MIKEKGNVCLFLNWMNTRIQREAFYNIEVLFLQPSHTHTWLYPSDRSELLLENFLAIWGDSLAILETYMDKTESFPSHTPHDVVYPFFSPFGIKSCSHVMGILQFRILLLFHCWIKFHYFRSWLSEVNQL